MTLSHLYQNFGDKDRRKDEILEASAEEVEDQKLQSFEDGYKAGWDDAIKAQSESRAHLSTEFSQNLQEATFGYHEARAALLKELLEFIEPVFEKLLPKMAGEALAAHVVEQVMDLSKDIMERPIEIAVSPKQAGSMRAAFEDSVSEPCVIKPDETLAPDQVMIRVGAKERAVELEPWVDDIAGLVSSHFNTLKKESSID